MSQSGYVIVSFQQCYSSDDRKVIGLVFDEKEAIKQACLLVVDQASQPYKIKFYKKTKSEYYGVSEFSIQHWRDNQHVETILIGHTRKPFRHYIDAYLKENRADVENILASWKTSLDRGEIPEFLAQHTFRI